VTTLQQSTHATVRYYAVRSLGQFGEQARSAAPQLLKELNDPDERTRAEVIKTLTLIAPEVLTHSVAR